MLGKGARDSDIKTMNIIHASALGTVKHRLVSTDAGKAFDSSMETFDGDSLTYRVPA